jgi:hypothetical protein
MKTEILVAIVGVGGTFLGTAIGAISTYLGIGKQGRIQKELEYEKWITDKRADCAEYILETYTMIRNSIQESINKRDSMDLDFPLLLSKFNKGMNYLRLYFPDEVYRECGKRVNEIGLLLSRMNTDNLETIYKDIVTYTGQIEKMLSNYFK